MDGFDLKKKLEKELVSKYLEKVEMSIYVNRYPIGLQV